MSCNGKDRRDPAPPSPQSAMHRTRSPLHAELPDRCSESCWPSQSPYNLVSVIYYWHEGSCHPGSIGMATILVAIREVATSAPHRLCDVQKGAILLR
jgi:hypothetical protein